MSCLFRNPKDRFCHVEAHLSGDSVVVDSLLIIVPLLVGFLHWSLIVVQYYYWCYEYFCIHPSGVGRANHFNLIVFLMSCG